MTGERKDGREIIDRSMRRILASKDGRRLTPEQAKKLATDARIRNEQREKGIRK